MKLTDLQLICAMFTGLSDGSVSVGHDEIFVDGPEPSKLTEIQRDILNKNGWYWETTFMCWSHSI